MASVRKHTSTRKGKPVERYAVDYTDLAGKRRFKLFDRKKEADAYLDKVKREIFQGIHMAAREAIPFAKLADLYLRDFDRRWKLGDIAGNTFDLARRLTDNHLVPEFGGRKVNEIETKHVQEFINRKAEIYSRITVHKLLKHMKDALQFGVDNDYLKRNVLRDRPARIPRGPREQIEIPSLEGLKRMAEVVSSRRHEFRQRYARPTIERIVVYLALFCGMRRGEISGLTWEHVDFDALMIRVRHSRSRFDGLKGPKTKAGLRDVPMPDALAEELLALREELGASYDIEGPVLRNRFGGPISPDEIARQYWAPVAEAANLRRKDGTLFGMHALRHSAASLWAMGGLPLLALKKAIGHSSVSTTLDVYGHLFPEDQATRRAVSDAVASLRIRPSIIEAEPISAE